MLVWSAAKKMISLQKRKCFGATKIIKLIQIKFTNEPFTAGNTLIFLFVIFSMRAENGIKWCWPESVPAEGEQCNQPLDPCGSLPRRCLDDTHSLRFQNEGNLNQTMCLSFWECAESENASASSELRNQKWHFSGNEDADETKKKWGPRENFLSPNIQ